MEEKEVLDELIKQKKPTISVHLRKKIGALMKSIDYIQKDGENTSQRYRYVTAAKVLGRVQESLLGLGLFSVPEFSVVEVSEVEREKPPAGQRVIVQCRLGVFDTEGVEDDRPVIVTALGGGQDVGDKAVMKAQTAAMKYAWMQLLNISVGDDPEADESSDRP